MKERPGRRIKKFDIAVISSLAIALGIASAFFIRSMGIAAGGALLLVVLAGPILFSSIGARRRTLYSAIFGVAIFAGLVLLAHFDAGEMFILLAICVGIPTVFAFVISWFSKR